MTTVTWVQNVDGYYEVSSADHLIQIMNRGGVYISGGSPPSEFFAANYIQTADIDLLGDSTHIKPIGLHTNPPADNHFVGVYDGQNYTISNWSYVDPAFPTNATTAIYAVGLFGAIGDNTVLKNIRIGGVCSLKGLGSWAGFLLGRNFGKSNCHIMNIVVDLEPGSEIDPGDANTSINVGGVIGEFSTSSSGISGTITGITLRGSLNFPRAFDGSNSITIAGIIGLLRSSYISGIQNQATFPSGINAATSGGIVGYTFDSSLVNCINAMNGNMAGQTSGGIVGYISDTTTEPKSLHTLINAMTGDMSMTWTAGGVFGFYRAIDTAHTFINYMNGDIVSPTYNGGIIGRLYSSALTLSSSINAMNGSVQNTVTGSASISSTITVNTDFGLTYTGNNSGGTSSPPTGLLTDSGFPDLPYVTLQGTDSDGNTYDLDFVYPNLSGNSLYNSYTHLILHKGVIHTPFTVNFIVAEGNTTLFLTYVNAGTQFFLQGALQVAPPPGTWVVETRSINILVILGEVPGSLSFKLTYEGPSGFEVTASSGFTDLRKNIVNLNPETQYTIRLYADTGGGYQMTQESTTTTLANSSSNYVASDFESNGVFDLTSVDETTRTELSGVMDQLFDTGDVVNVSVDTDTSFIKLGESLSIKDLNGVLLPFDNSNGSGQDVTVVLSDATNIDVAYDENTNTITVNSSSYGPGSVFVLDGKKVRVVDY